jgi:phage baseplate assembly protein W
VATVDFVGTGFAFPMGVGPAGGTAMVSGSANVEQAMLLVLGTARGERPMRPDFGCGIHDLVFESVDETLCGTVAFEVETSLTRWVPRIEVTDVAVRPDPAAPSTLLVDVAYVVRSTNDQRNLVFPFYSIPEHE